MTRTRLARLLVAVAALAGVGSVTAIGGSAAPSSAGAAATYEVSRAGVGPVKLRSTYTKLRQKKLVGRIRPGCELAGPQARGAALRLPLRGFVDFTDSSPRRVRTINVTRGAAARGVGIGATLEEIRAAFPNARVERGTEETFLITLVQIPRRDGGPFEFAVDTDTDRVTLIGVPGIAFCE